MAMDNFNPMGRFRTEENKRLFDPRVDWETLSSTADPYGGEGISGRAARRSADYQRRQGAERSAREQAVSTQRSGQEQRRGRAASEGYNRGWDKWFSVIRANKGRGDIGYQSPAEAEAIYQADIMRRREGTADSDTGIRFGGGWGQRMPVEESYPEQEEPPAEAAVVPPSAAGAAARSRTRQERGYGPVAGAGYQKARREGRIAAPPRRSPPSWVYGPRAGAGYQKALRDYGERS